MSMWNFRLRLNRALSDDEVDALYEAGLDDAGIQARPVGLLDVDREADTLLDAVLSAVGQAESVEGLRVAELVDSDAVTLAEIAERVGRTYESIRLLAEGKRGPGGFPAPLHGLEGPRGARLYSWVEVREWLLGAGVHLDKGPAVDRTLPAIRGALLLRDALLALDPSNAAKVRHLVGA
ncbi:hypothetical protein GCM10009547_25670 [Sporichthya brevicatena]|uniref:DNA-binding protein n=1 Tax=Sporichthya brevicatena TaxID=171442 RepID=A0ABN1GWD8_9ACTN